MKVQEKIRRIETTRTMSSQQSFQIQTIANMNNNLNPWNLDMSSLSNDITLDTTSLRRSSGLSKYF